MRTEFRKKEAMESMAKFVRELREHAGLSREPISAHLRIAYDTYMNLYNDVLSLEYLGYDKPVEFSVTTKFKTSKYMSDKDIETYITAFMVKAGTKITN